MKLNFVKVKLLPAVILLAVSISAFSNSGPGDSKAPPSIVGAAVATTSTESGTSNTACYFNNNGRITWQWGLNSDNGWYSFTGQWITTPHTEVKKFRTTTAYESIYQSCVNSKRYYNVNGELFAIFAATSSLGSNYPILLGGGDLFPNY